VVGHLRLSLVDVPLSHTLQKYASVTLQEGAIKARYLTKPLKTLRFQLTGNITRIAQNAKEWRIGLCFQWLVLGLSIFRN
jgi:hypothetical protein